ncbi:hypothetical protein HRR83_006877 [Exophiala dermatitidis]|uniref:PH domain-containing protein n=1 Tax=Exophiala dermatitidis TaxID=5970 RepID=A0AAN6IT54_EXODE|nr:hypothetical protein HRR75_005923 [Exophiala dermatitidis]KAJ4512361.1 hypothetical protein HRR73_005916 [Exophiala dermatitidis]KAJ4512763.1 hypothetical protein HRR74_006461 [Exophiala dermatitidis]KAJ4542570.1 hypothetical protein HRR77_005767 [Exophiala dermatitidis]KAJ4546510.1 hypothetical protein HRR78_005511 [Exophiala dermatitidis]
MAATSPLRPSTPSRAGAMPAPPPHLSPHRIPAAFAPASYQSGHRHLDVFSPVDQNGSFCFDRVIKSGRVNRRIKNKGAWKPSWKPAYLVLRPNLLSVYQNADETDLKASITLSEVNAVAPVRKAHMENVFGVFSPSKNYHFQGLSPADTADWIAHIRAEARTEDEDDFDILAPQFSSQTTYSDMMLPNTSNYESTDLSADEVAAPLEATSFSRSPERYTTASSVHGGASRKGSQVTSHQHQRRTSTLQEYSGNEQFTTSHSDFSDGLGTSLPRTSALSLHNRPPVLTPIASSQQLYKNGPPSVGPKSPVPPPATPNDPTTVDPERVIRHGYLQVLKSHKTGVKGWKWIWVVLRPRTMAFYKDDQEYSAVKVFPMDSVIDAAEIDPISKSKKFCFQVIMDDKSYRFCAPTEDDLAKWLGALKSVLSRRHEADKAMETFKGNGRGHSIVDATAALSLR